MQAALDHAADVEPRLASAREPAGGGGPCPSMGAAQGEVALRLAFNAVQLAFQHRLRPAFAQRQSHVVESEVCWEALNVCLSYAACPLLTYSSLCPFLSCLLLIAAGVVVGPVLQQQQENLSCCCLSCIVLRVFSTELKTACAGFNCALS